ncbi:hypothetical protein AcW1_002019 [Taiwanofungus camphoratus]|nr:hypothetical protein AcV5_010016 [Antrodia cinnamomea]KAI0944267.1 hypothetical protein AcW1_002019 [Antrodia cinnamomea]KAI0945911.1 hypothetical protein AcV7_010025 [Antrodia cinnamomea]
MLISFITHCFPRTRTLSTSAKHALYLDRGVLIVNKPPGLVCQFDKTGSQEGESQDFNNFVLDLKDSLALGTDLHPVHRLDKGTTGALAFALTPENARDLAQQFRAHTVEKIYLALVRGGSASFSSHSGTIRGAHYNVDGRISTIDSGERDGGSKRGVAETDWEVIASSPSVPITLVKLRPYTGLKHQLRVHMAQTLKTPILGDMLYSRSKLSSKITDVTDVPKDLMYLHASQLSIFRYRPSGGQKRFRLTVGVPLPGFFVRLCARLHIPLHADFVKGGLWADGIRYRTERAASGQINGSDKNGGEEKADIENIGGRWLGK